MINYSYFKYLLKSKKYVVIFAFLISLLISLTNTGKGYMLAYAGLLAICIGLCYALPCLIFSYVHNKKAVDSYYSLDIDRKSMLITGLLFCFLSVFIVFTINVFIIYFSEVRSASIYITNNKQLLSLPIRLLLMNLAFLTLIIFNTYIYLIANTVFDGIVMIAAYTVLPLIIGLLLVIFLNSFIFGYNETLIKFIGYLSPIYVLVNLFTVMFVDQTIFTNNIPVSVFVLLLFLVVIYLALYNDYKKRKVERAGTISNNVLSYPFIINAYALICVFIITCDTFYGSSLFYSLSEAIIFYAIIFTLFVIAYFVFSRKLIINYKTPIIFGIYILLSLGICFIAKNTEGFGLSRVYTKNDPSVTYDLSVEYYDSRMLKGNDFDTWILNNLPELPENTSEDSVYDPDSRYLHLYISSANAKESLSKDTIDIFERIRVASIDEHYNPAFIDDGNNNQVASYLTVHNDVHKYNNGKFTDFESGYSYRYNNYGYQPLTLNELLKLSYDKNITINMYYGNGELNDYYSFNLIDGKLILAR